MSQCFSKQHEPFGGDVNVKVDLSNYATKANLKNTTGIDTSRLAAKSDLVSLIAEVDKLDIGKIVSIPVVLKIDFLLKIMLLKKAVYDELVEQVNKN